MERRIIKKVGLTPVSMKRMKIVRIAIISFDAFIFGGAASGQSICVVGEYSLKSVDGFVLLRNKIPIENAHVTVRNSKGSRKVVDSIFSDANGRFQFPRLTRGTYLVEFEYPTLVRITALITLSKRIDGVRKLFVEMDGIIGEPCGGGDTYVRSLNTTR